MPALPAGAHFSEQSSPSSRRRNPRPGRPTLRQRSSGLNARLGRVLDVAASMPRTARPAPRSECGSGEGRAAIGSTSPRQCPSGANSFHVVLQYADGASRWGCRPRVAGRRIPRLGRPSPSDAVPTACLVIGTSLRRAPRTRGRDLDRRIGAADGRSRGLGVRSTDRPLAYRLPRAAMSATIVAPSRIRASLPPSSSLPTFRPVCPGRRHPSHGVPLAGSSLAVRTFGVTSVRAFDGPDRGNAARPRMTAGPGRSRTAKPRPAVGQWTASAPYPPRRDGAARRPAPPGAGEARADRRPFGGAGSPTTKRGSWRSASASNFVDGLDRRPDEFSGERGRRAEAVSAAVREAGAFRVASGSTISPSSCAHAAGGTPPWRRRVGRHPEELASLPAIGRRGERVDARAGRRHSPRRATSALPVAGPRHPGLVSPTSLVRPPAAAHRPDEAGASSARRDRRRRPRGGRRVRRPSGGAPRAAASRRSRWSRFPIGSQVRARAPRRKGWCRAVLQAYRVGDRLSHRGWPVPSRSASPRPRPELWEGPSA